MGMNVKEKLMLLFKNRQFIAIVAALVFALLQVFIPDLPISEEQNVAFFGLVAAYIIGEGLEGPRIVQNFKQLFGSRKFLSLLAGALVIVVQAIYPEFPVKPEQVTELFVVFGALILGSGAEAISAK